MDLEGALRQELETRKGAILGLCRDLIRIPTENPPGPGIATARSVFA